MPKSSIHCIVSGTCNTEQWSSFEMLTSQLWPCAFESRYATRPWFGNVFLPGHLIYHDTRCVTQCGYSFPSTVMEWENERKWQTGLMLIHLNQAFIHPRTVRIYLLFKCVIRVYANWSWIKSYGLLNRIDQLALMIWNQKWRMCSGSIWVEVERMKERKKGKERVACSEGAWVFLGSDIWYVCLPYTQRTCAPRMLCPTTLKFIQ